jgi:hypothetical protein
MSRICELYFNNGFTIEVEAEDSLFLSFVDEMIERISGLLEPEWLDHDNQCYITFNSTFSLSIFKEKYICFKYISDESKDDLYLKLTHWDDLKEVINSMIYAQSQMIKDYNWSTTKPSFLEFERTTKKLPQGLHDLVRHGLLEQVKVELQNGADIDCLNDDYLTPLMLAILHRKYEIVKFLLESNANKFIEDDLGFTPVTLAINTQDEVLIGLLTE